MLIDQQEALMDQTMKAAVVRGFWRPLTIERRCGVCHTNLHAAADKLENINDAG